MSVAIKELKPRSTARVSLQAQALLAEAAAYLGVPVNSFLVSAAVEKTGDVLAGERLIPASHSPCFCELRPSVRSSEQAPED